MGRRRRRSRPCWPSGRQAGVEVRKILFALLFLAGGISHEIRNPISCLCIASGSGAEPKRRRDPQALKPLSTS